MRVREWKRKRVGIRDSSRWIKKRKVTTTKELSELPIESSNGDSVLELDMKKYRRKVISYLSNSTDERELEEFCEDEQVPVNVATRLMNTRPVLEEAKSKMVGSLEASKFMILKRLMRQSTGRSSVSASKLWAEITGMLSKGVTVVTKGIGDVAKNMTDEELNLAIGTRIKDLDRLEEGKKWRDEALAIGRKDVIVLGGVTKKKKRGRPRKVRHG